MLVLLCALVASQAPAQPAKPVSAYDRAIAAGYKAAMLCGGIFNGGRTRTQVEADELKGIYPEYEPIVPSLTARVDRDRALVSVDWSQTMPPRLATWSRGKGCTILPIGAGSPPILAAGRAPGPAPADPRPWPQGDSGIAPRPSAALAAVVGKAFDGASYGRGSKTTAVIVVRDGSIIAERYRDGFGPFTSQRTWSVAKSIAGAIIGWAQHRGRIDVAKPANIPEWRHSPELDLRAAITTDNLLRMASGLHSSTAGNRTDAIYFGGTAVSENAPFWPLEARPGTRFRYANNDILLAMRALRGELRDDRAFADLPNQFFARLGMSHSVAEADWRGDFILSSQAWSTARDLARFGLFLAQDGFWNGERMLPEGWIAESIAPRGPQPLEGPGYGRTLWLFGPAQQLPAGSYAAQGNRGQYVMVVPSRRIILVRRGEDPGTRFDIAGFARDVLAALR
jgi:CubicO group peptidase (beta-lactamase class C family)